MSVRLESYRIIKKARPDLIHGGWQVISLLLLQSNSVENHVLERIRICNVEGQRIVVEKIGNGHIHHVVAGLSFLRFAFLGAALTHSNKLRGARREHAQL